MSFESQDGDSYAGDDERKRDSSRKRDGKKEKKEKGYQMFEEEDSEEESLVLAEDLKSPSKTIKEKLKPAFKFPVPVRKEKGKEKEEKKDKETKQEEKEKKKEEKKKHKKEKKKVKHDPGTVIDEPNLNENPIFGVPLATAVERNKSHDGIELPAIVRECIDYIEECGLACEGIYRISGVKSKVQHLKDCYNRQQPVYLYEHEPNIVASLLKQFLRDLPEPVLTTALMPKFEEASTIKNNKKKVEAFTKLIADLPTCNRLLLSWMIVHMTHVIDLAKENKMTLQNVSIVLSPTMQISHRVLNILFSNVSSLFADVLLRKYVPPLKPAHSKWTLELPDNTSALEEELAKQESLLNQLHADLNSGREDPVIEEQLWEVQRVVTQLKRKIKMANKSSDKGERRRMTNVESKRSSTSSIPSLSAPEELKLDLRPAPEPSNVKTVTAVVEKQPEESKSEIKDKTESVTEPPKKGVKFAEESEKDSAPTAGDVKTKDVEKSDSETKEVEKGKEVQADIEKTDDKTEAVEKEKETKEDEKKSEENVEKQEKEDGGEAEASKGSGDAVTEVVAQEKEKVVVELPAEEAKKDVKVSPSAEVEEQDKTKSAENKEEKKDLSEKHTALEQEKKVVTENQEGKPSEVAKEPSGEPVVKKDLEKDVQQEKDKEEPVAEKTEVDRSSAEREESAATTATTTPPVEEKAVSKPKPAKVEYVYRKPPNPPFMSTALLQPMKAELPKKKPVEFDNEMVKENIRKSEELRELEEELLGEKKADKDSEDYVPDDVEMDQLLEEEYALKMEEEELLAIADELRQKIATERSEMERLNQEIQELQYLRQDSDLEDLSSSSMSSDDSEDEDDLQDLLSQLIQDNEELEMNNADLCQKIHEERMICLSVKLQIRLLQQKQLESSYG